MISLRQYWMKLKESGFVRPVAILAGGTAFGQVLMLLVLPILTRLYSPEDFSALAVYFGLLMSASAVASLRFDIAVPIPQSDRDAVNLLAVALTFSVITASLLALPVVLAADSMARMFGTPRLGPYLWLLPVGVFLVSSSSALQYWSTRNQNFPIIARTRIAQAVAGAGTMVGLGWIGCAPLGLILGQTIFNGAGLFGLSREALIKDRQALRSISLPEMRQVFRAYDRFPKYSALETFANSAGVQVPVILIAAMAAGPEAGFLALAMRVMQAPMAFIGVAIGQVYLSRAPAHYRAGALGQFTSSIVGGLMKTGVGPLLFAGMIAPDAFRICFGDEWSRAGVLVGWMTPWFVCQFLSSPISMALHVTNHQKLALLLQVFGLAVRVGLIILAAAFVPSNLSEVYAISGFIFYVVYLVALIRLAAPRRSELLPPIQESLPYVSAWVLAGVVWLGVSRL